jgi:pimeloyl-ACP methyl ester carboxylesterase
MRSLIAPRVAPAKDGGGLRKHEFGVVYCLDCSGLIALAGDVRSAAGDLALEAERICEATGANQVHVVGHSLGGLVARYYVQRLGGDARVHTLVTLGRPHLGTMTAYLLPAPMLYQLRPNLLELAVWSELDGWIMSQRNARPDHPDLLVTNYLLRNVGHLSLAVDSRAVHGSLQR